MKSEEFATAVGILSERVFIGRIQRNISFIIIYIIIYIIININSQLFQENLDYRRAFPRHGRIEASFILLIWLTENLPVITG